ncbi:hypothetical protein Loa_02310 [Legionella oakridgensis ATCC 33761 = DSM 21215]|uniref:Uncharacterized protein n=2 Tax=Legionella oakridgensis TaxID=29423 RepID=W0BGW6_9GAMM|nr:hypothetical protein [Legionella oakridgensis]AHE67852.1 hypothetical protein Loa_02310 [Legionella oakridgensis ATCC 33761 = DSM 21215]KTD44094.1 hypothetical protein Loak_0236 [Legionella oakridgensis]STY20864.1 DNA-binding domain-containing protein [Legionella longbeachae]
MQKTGDLISELVVPDDLDTSETEAIIEVNLALVKFKVTPHVIPSAARDLQQLARIKLM